jgi:hypothetical protein
MTSEMCLVSNQDLTLKKMTKIKQKVDKETGD